MLKRQASEHFDRFPADQIRMMPSLGALGDDPEKFFRRPLSDVSPGDLWRWVACRDVLREAGGKRDSNG